MSNGTYNVTAQRRLQVMAPITKATAYAVLGSTTTVPATTAASHALIYSPNEDGPTVVYVRPYASANNLATCHLRAVGVNSWPDTVSGTTTTKYEYNVLCDFLLEFVGTAQTVSIGGTTYHYFSKVTQDSGTVVANIYSPGHAATPTSEPCAFAFDAAGSEFVLFQVWSGSGSIGAFWKTYP